MIPKPFRCVLARAAPHALPQADHMSTHERLFGIRDQFLSGSPESEYRVGRIEGARPCVGRARPEAVSRSSWISAGDGAAADSGSVEPCAPPSRRVRAGPQGSSAQPASWLHASTDVQWLHSCSSTPPTQRAGIMATTQVAAIDMANRRNIGESLLGSTIMSIRRRSDLLPNSTLATCMPDSIQRSKCAASVLNSTALIVRRASINAACASDARNNRSISGTKSECSAMPDAHVAAKPVCDLTARAKSTCRRFDLHQDNHRATDAPECCFER